MIDKLALRVPKKARLLPRFERLLSDGSLPQAHSRFYRSLADLRPVGIPAFLHWYCQMGNRGSHKIEFLETSQIGYSKIAPMVEGVFDVNAMGLELMRLDLAADVPDFSPSWFRNHSRVRFKRHAAEVGESAGDGAYAAMGQARIETVYSGKRPDMIRVYDKAAERRMQYARLVRAAKRKKSPAPPPFDEIYGHPATGTVITRVEHEYGSGKVPRELETLAKLRRAGDFNPFARLEMVREGLPDLDDESHSANAVLTAYGLRSLIEEIGFARARAWLNKKSKGNAAKIMARHAGLGSRADAECVLPNLFAIYRESVGRQLAN